MMKISCLFLSKVSIVLFELEGRLSPMPLNLRIDR